MVFRFKDEEWKIIAELFERVLEKMAAKKPKMTAEEGFYSLVNSDFAKAIKQIEEAHFTSLETPEDIVKDAEGLINDAILYEYAANSSFEAENLKTIENIPVLLLTDDYIRISDLTDLVTWRYKQEQFMKVLEHQEAPPKVLFARSGFEKHIRVNVISRHIEAVKGTPKEKDLEAVISECLSSSKYIVPDEILKEENPFIVKKNGYTGERRIVDTSKYTAMNSLVTTKLVSTKPRVSKNDIPGQYTMQWDIIEPKEVFYFATVDFKHEKDISVDSRLDLFDMEIINAIGSIYIAHQNSNPGEPCYIIPLDIWRLMRGKSPNERMHMTSKQEKDLVDHIEKLRRTFFSIDLKSQMEKYGFTFDERFSQKKGIANDTVLNLTAMAIQTARNSKIVTDGYRVNTEPILFTYSRRRKQIITVERELLNVTEDKNLGENTLPFRNYLLRRIASYKSGHLSNNIIKLETIYRDTGVKEPTQRIDQGSYKDKSGYEAVVRRERAKDCKEITNILESWKSKQYIKDFRKKGQGKEISFEFEAEVIKQRRIEEK